jgi:hypothetical protein
MKKKKPSYAKETQEERKQRLQFDLRTKHIPNKKKDFKNGKNDQHN